MFRPNAIGALSARAGRDVYGQITFDGPIACPFAPVSMDLEALKTTVRADSSASRGLAEETVAKARILISRTVTPKNGDRFEYEGGVYEIVAVHGRRTVAGRLDHYDCKLQVLP